MTPTLQLFLIISSALFSIGLLAALSRRHAIFILIGIELMLAAANLNFIAFWRFGPQPQPPTGVMIAIFSIAIAAAEAVVGIVINLWLIPAAPLAVSLIILSLANSRRSAGALLAIIGQVVALALSIAAF